MSKWFKGDSDWANVSSKEDIVEEKQDDIQKLEGGKPGSDDEQEINNLINIPIISKFKHIIAQDKLDPIEFMGEDNIKLLADYNDMMKAALNGTFDNSSLNKPLPKDYTADDIEKSIYEDIQLFNKTKK